MEEKKTNQSSNTLMLEKKAIASKLKGLSDYLQSLIQKRLRLEIEIKKTKKKISKLKSNSSLQIKLAAGLEAYLIDPDDPKTTFDVLFEEREKKLIDQQALEALTLADQALESYTEIEPYFTQLDF